MVSSDRTAVTQWPAMLTWRSQDATRIESTRIQISGDRIKAVGRITATATQSNPAFSASYDLVTDDAGATKRLSLDVTLAERDRQLSIARDEENMWLVTTHEGQSRDSYEGALDVDMTMSPFFNALPIRRLGLYRQADSVTVPVVYVYLPELTVTPATLSYASSGPDGSGGIKLESPIADTTVLVDSDGFITEYPGLAERI